jgi:uncharacterized membrane protein YGL010W
MSTIEERMSGYAAYHKNPKNKATHFFGVPMVFYAPLIALGWLRTEVMGIHVSLATVALAAALIWYFTLDVQLAALMTVISIPIAYLCDVVSMMPFRESLIIFLAVKLGGWVIQLIGHGFEGRRPALVDNFLQALMAPLFLIAEVLFALGFRKNLEKKVNSRVAVYQFPVRGMTPEPPRTT